MGKNERQRTALIYANLCDIAASTRSLWLKACPKEFPDPCVCVVHGFCFLDDAAADIVLQMYAKLCLKCHTSRASVCDLLAI